MASGVGKLRQIAGWKALSARQGAKLGKSGPCLQGKLYSPALSSLEVTSRPQMYLSSMPRKAAIPGGWQSEPTVMTEGPLTEQSVETLTLRGHTWRTGEYSAELSPEISPKIPPCKKEIKASRKRSNLHYFLSPFLPPLLSSWAFLSWSPKLQGNRQLAAGPRLIPWTCPQSPLFSYFLVS